ncbi:MAG: 50S ribosomal protein L17 [Ekhidna sp.]|nr:50S ribosomal protein L17 [Ekhidna sp.]
MRHGKKFNHLGRKTAHRSAMLSNMASSLIKHKRINTTVAKAKALRKYIEPIITKSKTDDTHSRRVVFSYLQDKESVTELFNNVASKVASRPGGYTRIIKTGARLGDNSEMCMMELVDFNELLLGEETAAKTKTRRSRRGGGKAKAEAAQEDVAEAVVVEETTEDVSEESSIEESSNDVSNEVESSDDDTSGTSEDEKKED